MKENSFWHMFVFIGKSFNYKETLAHTRGLDSMLRGRISE